MRCIHTIRGVAKTEVFPPLNFHQCLCVEIIQWRVKFKKYHQLTNPKACVKCNEKTVKQAYHIVCKPCSSALKICCKCGKPNESINFEDTERQEDTDQKFIDALKNVRERERRTLLRLAHSNQSTTEVGSTITDKEKPSSLMDGANELIVEKLSKMNCNWKDEYETDDYESS
ncbi:unnamed protein product [Heterobilharzia americana]|nr:unnamed protein product [Heterobilharzia americana]